MSPTLLCMRWWIADSSRSLPYCRRAIGRREPHSVAPPEPRRRRQLGSHSSHQSSWYHSMWAWAGFLCKWARSHTQQRRQKEASFSETKLPRSVIFHLRREINTLSYPTPKTNKAISTSWPGASTLGIQIYPT